MLKSITIFSFLIILINAEENFMKDHFLYLSGGVSSFDVSYKLNEGDSFTKNSLDDMGSIFEVGVGYNINPSLFSTISYQKTFLENIDTNNYLLSINYKFIDLDLTDTYLGIIGGYSSLNWNKSPYPLQKDNKLTSSSFLLGAQVGIDYSITENVGIFLNINI